MKKLLIVFAVLIAYCLGQGSQRMSFVGRDKVDVGNGDRLHVVYLHDRETKQEVVCMFWATDAPNCYLTGRTW